MTATLAPVPVETPPTASSRTTQGGSRGGVLADVGRVLSILVVIVIIGPLLLMVINLFLREGTGLFTAFGNVFGASWFWPMLRDTLIAVGVSTIGALAIGSTLAWLEERTNAEMSWLSQLMPILPLFVPPLASAIGWVLLGTPGSGTLNVIAKEAAGLLGIDLGYAGPVDIFTWPGILALFTINLVPHVYLVVSAALRNLEPSLEEASRVSGVGAWGTLTKVTLPAIRPALLNALLLALSAGFALFSIPFLIGSSAGVDNLIVRVVRMTTYEFPAKLAEASVLGIIVVVVIGSSLLLQRRITRLSRHARMEGKTSSPSRIDLGWFKWVARVFMTGYVLLATVLPVLALIFVSLQSFWSGELSLANFTLNHYIDLLKPGTKTLDALRNSVVLGAITATVAMLVVTLVAYFQERRPRDITGRAADAVAKLPGALSHVVVALALIIAVAGPPFSLQGTLMILFLGYFVMYLPQASVNANSALSQIGPTLSESSLTSGASEWRTFVRVILPLMLPGVLGGWVMVFVLVTGDLTASAMLAGPSSPVAGHVMLDLATSGTYGAVSALGVMITLVGSVIGGTVLVLSRRTGRARGIQRRRPARQKGRAS